MDKLTSNYSYNGIESVSMNTTTTPIVDNSRTILQKVLTLAVKDIDNRKLIVDEVVCMNGIVSYLIHKEPDVRVLSSRIVLLLSNHPQNKMKMKQFPGLIANLTQVFLQSFDKNYNKDSDIDIRAKNYAYEALENLGVNMAYQDDKENNDFDFNVQVPKKENLLSASKIKTPLRDAKYNSMPYHTITVQIDGIFDDFARGNIERVILNVHGVISVTLDKDHGRASIGTRSDIESDIIEAISNAGSNASVWPPKAVAEKQNKTNNISSNDDDGYINENDYDENNYSSNGSTILRWGTSTLASKLEERRKEEEEKKTSS